MPLAVNEQVDKPRDPVVLEVHPGREVWPGHRVRAHGPVDSTRPSFSCFVGKISPPWNPTKVPLSLSFLVVFFSHHHLVYPYMRDLVIIRTEV